MKNTHQGQRFQRFRGVVHFAPKPTLKRMHVILLGLAFCFG